MDRTESAFRPARRSDRPSLAVLGASGLNATQRVLPRLVPLAGDIDIVCYDLHVPAGANSCFQWAQVTGEDDLARRLLEQQPTDVWIETPCSHHPTHIRAALAAAAERVVCGT